MRYFLISLVLIVIPLSGLSQEVAPNCELQTEDFEGNVPRIGDAISTEDADGARVLRDFLNSAVNYYFQEPLGVELRGHLGMGGQIRSPVCNEAGQCVQSMIEINFSHTVSVGFAGISTNLDLVKDGYRVVVEDAGGETMEYIAAETGQRELAVPASGPEGLVHQDQTCRNNDHTMQGDFAGGGGGDIGGEGPIGGGTLVLTTGSGGCWRFVARDSDGNEIGSYTRCF